MSFWNYINELGNFVFPAALSPTGSYLSIARFEVMSSNKQLLVQEAN